MNNEKLIEALRFYTLATKLKYKLRTGFTKTHWNIKSERIESIAEHVYGTLILAICLDSQFEFNLDLTKVLKMLILHEIGEVIIGDITMFNGISKEEKEKLEHKAMQTIIGDLIKKEEMMNLLLEFDERTSKEAIFAYHVDKLEADIQSKIYQDMGMHHDLNDQSNNIVFTFEKTQKIVKNGAETPFDIWYEYDKEIYENDPIFLEMLTLLKSVNTQKDFKY